MFDSFYKKDDEILTVFYAFLLGSVFSLGLLTAVHPSFELLRKLGSTFGSYVVVLCIFHLLEYLSIKVYTGAADSSTFLIDDGVEYFLAILASVSEHFIGRNFVIVGRQQAKIVGWCLIIAGEILRLVAIASAKKNFSQIVAEKRKPDHSLVTSHVYGYIRHPAYAGYYAWAVGTQLLLGNPMCTAGYAIILWIFFSRRIKTEEMFLCIFFGTDYKVYRTKVWSGIPFIS